MITFQDKVALNENPDIPEVNKITDDNINSLKTGINTNETNISTLSTSVSNITGQILWTNSSPTSDFSSQTITLSSGDYDFLEIFFCSNVQSDNKTFEIRKTIKNYDVTLSTVVQNANTYRIVRFTDATHLAVESGYVETNVQDRRCVPLYVIGYKTGLF